MDADTNTNPYTMNNIALINPKIKKTQHNNNNNNITIKNNQK